MSEARSPATRSIRRAVSHGELPRSADPDAIVDRIAGPILYRTFLFHDGYHAADVTRLVQDTLVAVAT